MFLQLGLACVIIWFINILWISWVVIKHNPDWRDQDKVDAEKIIMNFMSNASPETIEWIRRISTHNPMFGMCGLSLLLLSIIV